MPDNPSINHRQLAWITGSMITSGGILNLYTINVRLSEMDGWISYWVLVVYLFSMTLFFSQCIRIFPGKNVFEIMSFIFGKIIGTCVNILVLFHFWLIVMKDIFSLSAFTSIVLLDQTPIEIIVFLTCLIMMYYGKSNVEVVARVNDIFYPIFTLSLFIMPLLLMNEIDWRLLHPVFMQPPIKLFASNLLTFGTAGDVFILGAFLHTLIHPIQFRTAMRFGFSLGICLIILISLMEILVLGPKIPKHLLYAVYEVVQMIQPTEFLDRIDLFLFSIWLPTIACKIIFSYLAMMYGIQHVLNIQQNQLLNKPVSIGIAFIVLLCFHNTSQLISFVSFSLPLFVLVYQPALILIAFVMIHLKSKKKIISIATQPDLQLAQSTNQKIHLWTSATLGIILLQFVFIVVGFISVHTFPRIAYLCAGGYGLFVIFMVISSYFEMKTSLVSSKKQQTTP